MSSISPSITHKGVQDAELFTKIRSKNHESDILVESALQSMHFSEGENILDFGCGEGSLLYKYLVPIAQKYNINIVGIDISAAQIELASKLNSHPRVKYICGNILDEEFRKTSNLYKFDKIMSSWVFDYFQNPSPYLIELSKLLKDGGKLWLMTSADVKFFNYYEKIRTHSILGPLMAIPEQPNWVKNELCPAEAYKKFLSDSNLKLESLEVVTLTHACENMDNCTYLLTNMLSSATKLSDQQKEILNNLCANDVENNWTKNKIIDRNEPLSYDYKTLVFTATKH